MTQPIPHQTIGDAIIQKAQDAIAIFEYYRDDSHFIYQAANLALHDLQMEIYVSKQALELVQKHIAQAEIANIQATLDHLNPKIVVKNNGQATLAHNNVATTAVYAAQANAEPAT